MQFKGDPFSDPLPELRLGCPELFPIATDHQRGLLFLLLFLLEFVLFLSSQVFSPRSPLRPLRPKHVATDRFMLVPQIKGKPLLGGG